MDESRLAELLAERDRDLVRTMRREITGARTAPDGNGSKAIRTLAICFGLITGGGAFMFAFVVESRPAAVEARKVITDRVGTAEFQHTLDQQRTDTAMEQVVKALEKQDLAFRRIFGRKWAAEEDQ